MEKIKFTFHDSWNSNSPVLFNPLKKKKKIIEHGKNQIYISRFCFGFSKLYCGCFTE